MPSPAEAFQQVGPDGGRRGGEVLETAGTYDGPVFTTPSYVLSFTYPLPTPYHEAPSGKGASLRASTSGRSREELPEFPRTGSAAPAAGGLEEESDI